MSTVPYEKYDSGKYHYIVKSGFRHVSELFDKPLPYTGTSSFVEFSANPLNRGEINLPFRGWLSSQVSGKSQALALNRAISRFVDALGPKAELGSAVALLGESVSMVVNRATQLRRGYRALQSGNFLSFAKEFGLTRDHHAVTRTKRTRTLFVRAERMPSKEVSRQAGGLWLEYWMGWAPACADIHNALNALTTTLPWTTIRRSASSTIAFEQFVDNLPWSVLRRTADGAVLVKIQGNVRIDNPNLYLAGQLGVLNPAYVLYDMMPWSWMINWFVNIEQLVQGLVPPQGLAYDKLFVTTYASATGSVDDYDFGRGTTKATWNGYIVRRSLGASLPGYKAVINAPRLSVTRAATAISLLLQQLKAS